MKKAKRMSNQNAGQTHRSASPTPGDEAAVLETAGLERDDTACVRNVGEGTFSNEDKHSTTRIISSNGRVPVLAPDGEPLMPTKSSRARKWIKEGKALPTRTKLNIFAVQLTTEPSGRDKQQIVLGIDPGSKFTGIAVTSQKAIHCGFNLELPTYIVARMRKRRELRRRRRYRKTGTRQCRFLNRTGCKIPPSILARKQLELRVARELVQTYPISNIAYEDVKFDHYTKRWGTYFSHVEIGKNWLISELKKIASVHLFKGWDTSVRRKELGLRKNSNKNDRVPEAHISDAIALCSLVSEKIRLTDFHFDVIQRPKYSRRKLHDEQFVKGGIRRKYGGTTTPFVFRKGDYVEATQGKRTVRGWVSGFRESGCRISVSDFDWKRLSQFVVSKVRLLNRNTGLLLLQSSIHPTTKAVGILEVK